MIAAGSSLLAALAMVGCGATDSSSTTITNVSSSGATSTSGTHAMVTTVTRTATVSRSSSGAQTGSGGAGVASGATTTTTVNGTRPCTAATLALSFLGQQGATGHGELGFALRNTASLSCVTGGYPGVQFLDRDGGALPTTPTHTTSDFFGHTSVRALTVASEESVSFRLGVTHGAGSSAGCTTAHALQVIAPNDTATLKVAIPDGATECSTATVSPVAPGDSAYP